MSDDGLNPHRRYRDTVLAHRKFILHMLEAGYTSADIQRLAPLLAAMPYQTFLRYVKKCCGSAEDKRQAPTLNDLIHNVDDAVNLLQAFANRHRLLTLCRLAKRETCVGDLAKAVGIGQSPMSVHLGSMKDQKLVAARRDARTTYYSVASPRVAPILTALDNICRQNPWC